MKHLFVPYEIALQLKEKGFDEECFGWIAPDGFTSIIRLVRNSDCHTDNCAVPLYQQVIDYLREYHNIQINITWNKFYPKSPYMWEIRPTWIDQPSQPYGYSGMSETYYNALQRAIKEALKLI